MSEWHRRMLWNCCRVLATYDARLSSVEEHVSNFISENRVEVENKNGNNSAVLAVSDEDFLQQVFCGCVQYSAVISVVLEGFYNTDGKNTLRSEQPIYHVLCYLVLFELEELGMTRFRHFVNCLEVSAAYKFLNFFLDEKNLITWMKDGWNKLYEPAFVQNKLLNPLLRWLDDLQKITKHLKEKINNDIPPKKATIPTTETRPFNLTQPKPKAVPMPEPIPKLQKHKPIPKSLYLAPQQQAMIAKCKEKNRQQAEERLMEASRRQFACANPEKSHKTKEVLKNVAAEQNMKLDFNRYQARPHPNFGNKDVPIKMNTAAILREGQFYQKIEEEELKKLASLEAGTMDSAQFDEWQAWMKKKDLEAQLAEEEKRKLMGKLSHEEAILAKEKLKEENQNKVAQMKKEAEALMQNYLEQKLQEEQMIRNLVDQTLEGRRNTRDAQKRLQNSKRKIVQQICAENKELMRQALEEAEADMRRRLELIHQIRALESSPAPRHKTVDLTATSGARLLSEMSIVELRERLALMKMKQKEAEEKKRDEILQAKQAKSQQLIDTLECICKHRLEQTRSAAYRLEERKKGKLKMAPSSEELRDLQRQLEDKRQARLQVQQQAVRVPTDSILDYAGRRAQRMTLEENRWKELEQSRERSARLMSGDKPCSPAAQRLNFSAVNITV